MDDKQFQALSDKIAAGEALNENQQKLYEALFEQQQIRFEQQQEQQKQFQALSAKVIAGEALNEMQKKLYETLLERSKATSKNICFIFDFFGLFIFFLCFL